MHLKHGAGEEC